MFLNGKQVATLIGPVFQVVLPTSSLTDNNLLEIQVTNGMANRIADMDKKGIHWKKFYNTNFPSRLPANRGRWIVYGGELDAQTSRIDK
ncbi:hypothetical protein [Paraflavitalea speifideaquila]|uniref:hypothetical protein n=1 Tax=Paraflavitalea speifideaquila TaxID=3076558 RepID=UPI0028EFD179|nr:hypothetical protein [Paraflavitalea speifideiaquila]